MTYSSATTSCLTMPTVTMPTGNYVTAYPYVFSDLITSVTSANFYPASGLVTTGTSSITAANYLPGDGTSWQTFSFTVNGNEGENAIQLPLQSPLLSGQTWTDWNEVYRPPLPQIIVPRVDPAAQLLRDAARRREEEAEKKIVTARETARATARKTLLTLLDGGQKEMLEKEAAFELRIDDRIYRIRPGNTVQQLDAERKVLCSFCIHPYANEWLPEDDWAIAQKLLLEADEGEFLRIANRRAYA